LTEIYEKFIDDPDPEVRELALGALTEVAAIYTITGQPAEAAHRFEELARRCMETGDVARAAKAKAGRVELLYNQGRLTGAIADADNCVARFGEAAEADAGRTVGRVLSYKTKALYALSRVDETWAVFEQIGRRFADAGDPGLRAGAALSLYGMACRHGMRDLGQTSAFEAIVTRFEADGDPRVRQVVQKARAAIKARQGDEPRGRARRASKLTRKRIESTVASLGLAPELAEPVAAYFHSTASTVVTKTDDDAVAIVLPVIIDARLLPEPMSDRQFAELLRRWMQSPGEDDTPLQLAVARFADSADPELQLLAARALLLNGVRLASTKDPSACGVFAEVALRYRHAALPELRRAVAEALDRAAREMVKANLFEHAVAAYERIVAFCADASDPTLRETRARALLASCHGKAILGDFSGGLRDADRVLSDYAEDPAPEVQTVLGHAMARKAITLFKIGRPIEGTQLHDEFIAQFGGSSDPDLRELVKEVREVRKHAQT
jgi:hypothetical protein